MFFLDPFSLNPDVLPPFYAALLKALRAVGIVTALATHPECICPMYCCICKSGQHLARTCCFSWHREREDRPEDRDEDPPPPPSEYGDFGSPPATEENEVDQNPDLPLGGDGEQDFGSLPATGENEVDENPDPPLGGDGEHPRDPSTEESRSEDNDQLPRLKCPSVVDPESVLAEEMEKSSRNLNPPARFGYCGNDTQPAPGLTCNQLG